MNELESSNIPLLCEEGNVAIACRLLQSFSASAYSRYIHMNRLVECVPNFSEGRRVEVVDAIVAALTSNDDRPFGQRFDACLTSAQIRAG